MSVAKLSKKLDKRKIKEQERSFNIYMKRRNIFKSNSLSQLKLWDSRLKTQEKEL